MTKLKSRLGFVALCVISMACIVLAMTIAASATSLTTEDTELTYNEATKTYSGVFSTGNFNTYHNSFYNSVYFDCIIDGPSVEIQSGVAWKANYKYASVIVHGSDGTKIGSNSGTSEKLKASYTSYAENKITDIAYFTMMTDGNNASARDLQGYIINVERI